MSKTVHATGKRKRAVASAIVKEGNGNVKINNMAIEFVKPELYRLRLKEPLILADDLAHKVDITVECHGGGMKSQSDAARLAISKALVEYAKSEKLKRIFLDYDRSLLVADIRRKETRKPNRHGKARAKVQKSYR